MGDSVLERNLCFIDTPGYGIQTSVSNNFFYSDVVLKSQCLECINPVIDYIESQFKKTNSFDDMSELEIINLLSGNGGSQVDVVLYAISNSKSRLLAFLP